MNKPTTFVAIFAAVLVLAGCAKNDPDSTTGQDVSTTGQDVSTPFGVVPETCVHRTLRGHNWRIRRTGSKPPIPTVRPRTIRLNPSVKHKTASISHMNGSTMPDGFLRRIYQSSRAPTWYQRPLPTRVTKPCFILSVSKIDLNHHR